MPDGDFRAYQGNTKAKAGVPEWMLTAIRNPSPTITSAATKIYTFYEL